MDANFPRFEITGATVGDLQAIRQLAQHLNTVNLPNDAQALGELLARSERSFARAISAVQEREYVFLLRDRQSGRALGTSMVIGQLGRRNAPYIYFAVRREEKYSATLDRHFVHTILDTTYSYAGPTELGGLVMDPDYRGRRERFGTLISFVRLLFVRMRRADFQDQLLAELLPPFRDNGESALWEAVGRRFTGLSYAEADRLSRRNKEFIRGLFPDSIYATLLDPEAQRLIGQVGPKTVGVEKLLSRIGFRYAERVDPFDGGPHFTAPTDQVSIVAGASSLATASPSIFNSPVLVAVQLECPPFFRAAPLTPGWRPTGVDRQHIAHALGATDVADVWVMPLR